MTFPKYLLYLNMIKTCSNDKIDKPIKRERGDYLKNYYKKNKELICKKSKIYNQNNNDKVLLRKKQYRKTKKKKIQEYNKNYGKLNKTKINAYHRKYRNDVLKINPLFICSSAIRDSIRNAIKNKGYIKKSKTINILGCTFDEFKKHIESHWQPWMNWDNYGNPKDGVIELNKTWDLDHIIPKSSANTEEDVIKLNHYTNFQPLCSYVNRFIKRGQYPNTNHFD